MLTLFGAGFLGASTVLWDGQKVTSYGPGLTGSGLGQGAITVVVPANLTAGTTTVDVVNPAPGGGTSNSIKISIVAEPKIAITLAPGHSDTATVTAGQAATYSLLASSESGFTGVGLFSCAGKLPIGVSCVVNPPKASIGAKPVSIAVTVKTSGAGAETPTPAGTYTLDLLPSTGTVTFSEFPMMLIVK